MNAELFNPVVLAPIRLPVDSEYSRMRYDEDIRINYYEYVRIEYYKSSRIDYYKSLSISRAAAVPGGIRPGRNRSFGSTAAEDVMSPQRPQATRGGATLSPRNAETLTVGSGPLALSAGRPAGLPGG